MPYNASLETTVSKPIGANGMPDGGRMYYHDVVNFKWRPFLSKSEAFTELPTTANRKGHFLVMINTGGTLAAGVITGGVNEAWWWKNVYTDAGLVLFTGSSTRKLEFVVGDGTANTPVNGASTFTNSLFIDAEILDFNIEGSPIPGIVRTGLTYGTLNSSTGVYNMFNGSFSTGDYIKILYKYS